MQPGAAGYAAATLPKAASESSTRTGQSIRVLPRSSRLKKTRSAQAFTCRPMPECVTLTSGLLPRSSEWSRSIEIRDPSAQAAGSVLVIEDGACLDYRTIRERPELSSTHRNP
jgi:hypothetical protein